MVTGTCAGQGPGSEQARCKLGLCQQVSLVHYPLGNTLAYLCVLEHTGISGELLFHTLCDKHDLIISNNAFLFVILKKKDFYQEKHSDRLII